MVEMDITLAPVIYFLALDFVSLLGIWIYTRNDANRTSRFEKMVGAYLVWFILNGIYFISLFYTPVFYEPAPIYPWRNVPFFLGFVIIISIPYYLDLIRHYLNHD